MLSNDELTASQVSRLNRMRWGIELPFRSFKQTFGRGELHSRRAECAVAELEWSLLGLTLIQMAAAESLISAGTDPERVSVSLAGVTARPHTGLAG